MPGPGSTAPSSSAGFRRGTYTLSAWHNRGGHTARKIEVAAGGLTGLELALDASGHRHTAHLNKFGKPYPSEGRRY